MDKEYYKERFKYSSHNGKNNREFEEKDLKSKDPAHGVFRFYGKCDFDDFDRTVVTESGWQVNALSLSQKETLKTHSGYKDHKETVHYDNSQAHAIMHRNYITDIHKLVIHSKKLEDNEDTIRVIKSMFELGLGTPLYDENNLPKALADKISKAKESKLIKKIKPN